MNRTEIFKENIGLAYTLAGKYQGSGRSRGIHFDDITQAALIATWEAVQKYDPNIAELSTFVFRHGHKYMQRFINSPSHFNHFTLERKPSGNSYHYVRRPNSTSLSQCAERDLEVILPNKPSDSPERSVLADQVLDILMSTEWGDRRVAALLGHLEGYDQPELAKELGVSRQTIFEDIHKTLDMLRLAVVG